jgi:hypothetical protein
MITSWHRPTHRVLITLSYRLRLILRPLLRVGGEETTLKMGSKGGESMSKI